MRLVERAHLGLFYLYGRYYSVVERVLECQRVVISEPEFARPSYAILGGLIFAEMAMRGMSYFSSFLSTMSDRERGGDDASKLSVAARAVPSENSGFSKRSLISAQCGVCLDIPRDLLQLNAAMYFALTASCLRANR